MIVVHRLPFKKCVIRNVCPLHIITDVWYHLAVAKSDNQASKVKALAKARGVLRPKDLAAKGIPRAVLGRLCAKGEADAQNMDKTSMQFVRFARLSLFQCLMQALRKRLISQLRVFTVMLWVSSGLVDKRSIGQAKKVSLGFLKTNHNLMT